MEGTGAKERGKVTEDEWIFSTAILFLFQPNNQLYNVQAPASLQQYYWNDISGGFLHFPQQPLLPHRLSTIMQVGQLFLNFAKQELVVLVIKHLKWFEPLKTNDLLLPNNVQFPDN